MLKSQNYFYYYRRQAVLYCYVIHNRTYFVWNIYHLKYIILYRIKTYISVIIVIYFSYKIVSLLQLIIFTSYSNF